MRKIFGIAGIAALMLSGCSGASEDAQRGTGADLVRVFGGIDIPTDQTKRLDTGTCVPTIPAAMLVFSNLEEAQVTIHDAAGEIVAITEFQTNHNEDFCSWFVDVDIEPESEFYKASFLDMETPVASIAESEPGEVNIDFLAPVLEKAEEKNDGLQGTPLGMRP